MPTLIAVHSHESMSNSIQVERSDPKQASFAACVHSEVSRSNTCRCLGVENGPTLSFSIYTRNPRYSQGCVLGNLQIFGVLDTDIFGVTQKVSYHR